MQLGGFQSGPTAPDLSRHMKRWNQGLSKHVNGKLSPWHKSAAAMTIVVLFDPTIDFWSRTLFTDKVGAAVEETTDANAFIDVCKELPPIDFGFFDDNAFDASIVAAQSSCHCSSFLVIVIFPCFFPAEVAASLL